MIRAARGATMAFMLAGGCHGSAPSVSAPGIRQPDTLRRPVSASDVTAPTDSALPFRWVCTLRRDTAGQLYDTCRDTTAQ